jgi:3-oxochol-4-en-24-oyl-CoA dehydrogenase
MYRYARRVDFGLSAEQEMFRLEVRQFLAAAWDPNLFRSDLEQATVAGGPPAGPWHRRLQEARLVAPHWPEQYGGRGLGLIERLIVSQELASAGALGPGNPIGIGWAGSTILTFGTEAQKDRFLRPILGGDEIWCQLFSEPGSGSDLASLTTRAERAGDSYYVTGQKVWTSLADVADWGILLARTDPLAGKHRGLTFFLIDLRQPGVEVRRIRQMTGEAEFCEVFLQQAHIPVDQVVGEVGSGWMVALTTLMNERIDLSTARGLLWGAGPSFGQVWRSLIDEIRLEVSRLTDLYISNRILELAKLRTLATADAGGDFVTQAAIQKLLADRFGQEVMTAVKDEEGALGMLAGSSTAAYLFSRALTIGGGTEEVQKNILGERALGLPADPSLASVVKP